MTSHHHTTNSINVAHFSKFGCNTKIDEQPYDCWLCDCATRNMWCLDPFYKDNRLLTKLIAPSQLEAETMQVVAKTGTKNKVIQIVRQYVAAVKRKRNLIQKLMAHQLHVDTNQKGIRDHCKKVAIINIKNKVIHQGDKDNMYTLEQLQIMANQIVSLMAKIQVTAEKFVW